ncbi:MAG: family 16 glycosylhydrolase [Muribaculaceae bacterium]|nr:family 16 glycosylhydrolase [Muribaculaceae bacterium]
MTHISLTQKVLALVTTLSLGLAANAQPAVPDGYEQVFADEFNGTALDSRVWNAESNGDGGGNQELQYYLPSNVSVANGHLVITARRQSYGGKSFTSGRINTMGKVAFKHGMVQASIKLPRTANGLWPAFWLMGNDLDSGTSWPYCGEIDVLEAGGRQGITEGTQDRFFVSALHWGPYQDGQHPMYSRTTTASYSLQDGQFHTYTMMWDEQKISMYLDEDTEPYFEMNINDASQQNSAGNYFHKQFFLLLNVAVGGNIPGILDPAGITALNSGEQTMEVDYVRVYQKTNDKNYFTPDGSEGDNGTGEVEEDTTTQLGHYGSLSLDDDGRSTFDFTNASDFVVIGASQGVIDQMGDRIRADYSVDDTNNFLYIWENTYTSKPSEGVNSFGLDEGYNRFVVNSAGWSGLGYASTDPTGTAHGKDMTMLDEEGYILHFAMRGTDALMHTAHAVAVGAAAFTIGAAPFNDNGKVLPVLGDFKRDGRWCSFDIPVSVLKSLSDPLYTNADNLKDNVLYFLSGGIAGAELQFDNVFFYKNSEIDTNPPADDTTTEIGKYAQRSLDDEGQSTFDFADGYDYVVIGASQGVIDQMGDNIRADYSVDEVDNFLYIWENTYTSVDSEGHNSFGLDEGYNHFVVNSVGWSGLGYASTNAAGTARGKDLSMLSEDGYYLHFAMKGNDVVRHASHTVGVGSAQFVIGNSSSGPIMLGDYRRDGQWYSFDIPLEELRSLYGEMFADDGGQNAFRGNVISFLSGGATGTELQFDNVFFYKRHSDDGSNEDIDPVLGRYGSPALDNEGQPTFDFAAGTDYVLIALGQEEATQIKEQTLADYRPDDVNNFLYIWEGTYQSNTSQGVNSMGYEEEYTSVTVANGAWSGMGFASTGGTGTGKDLSMIDDTYYLHFAIKSNDNQHVTHSVWAGNAKFSLGQTAFNDNGTLYGLLGDFYRDGKWYNFDIPVSKLLEFANPLFDNAANQLDNAIALLSGGNQGVNVNLDAVFFYRKGAVPPTMLTGDVNKDGEISVADITALVNIILENETPAIADFPTADVNKDNEISVADVTALVNIIIEQ